MSGYSVLTVEMFMYLQGESVIEQYDHLFILYGCTIGQQQLMFVDKVC